MKTDSGLAKHHSKLKTHQVIIFGYRKSYRISIHAYFILSCWYKSGEAIMAKTDCCNTSYERHLSKGRDDEDLCPVCGVAVAWHSKDTGEYYTKQNIS
jgi:hypothetical protein